MRVTRHHSCRVSPFGHPRIHARLTAPRGITQPPTSFIGSRCQGIHHAPLHTYTQTFTEEIAKQRNTHTTTPPPKGRRRHASTTLDARNHYPIHQTPHPTTKQGDNQNPPNHPTNNPTPTRSERLSAESLREPAPTPTPGWARKPVVSGPNSVPGSSFRSDVSRPDQRSLLCTRHPPTTGRRHPQNRPDTRPPAQLQRRAGISWCSLERR